jgi:phosphoribosylformimino-5-aminoimidazole carboxamide ribotide isomerase
MTKFRPCIDLHGGQVKQIVGGTLSSKAEDLQTNYVSTRSAGYFARLYREHDLRGGHVIMLGPGNEDAAREALREWPGGLQVGGGINAVNARGWIDAGAEKVGMAFYLIIYLLRFRGDCNFLSFPGCQVLKPEVGRNLYCSRQGSG